VKRRNARRGDLGFEVAAKKAKWSWKIVVYAVATFVPRQSHCRLTRRAIRWNALKARMTTIPLPQAPPAEGPVGVVDDYLGGNRVGDPKSQKLWET